AVYAHVKVIGIDDEVAIQVGREHDVNEDAYAYQPRRVDQDTVACRKDNTQQPEEYGGQFKRKEKRGIALVLAKKVIEKFCHYLRVGFSRVLRPRQYTRVKFSTSSKKKG